MARLGSPAWLSLGGIALDYDDISTGVFNFPPLSFFQIEYVITGYSAADALCIRFNGDSSSIYSYHAVAYDLSVVSYSTALAPYELTASAGSYIRTCAITTTGQQMGTIYVTCMPSVGTNLMTIMNSSTLASPNGQLSELAGSGNYSSYDQISSIELFTLNGNNLLAGSGFAVFGSQIG